MLKTTDLAYWYENESNVLFKDVNLEFMAGNLYAIVGQSGTGKTSLLALLGGLDVQRAGHIEYAGTDIAKIGLSNYRRRDVSMIFQSYNLLEYMSALDNLMTAMAITGAQHQGEREYARGMLRQLGLSEDQMVQNVRKLSGGQQQRVAIARTMVLDAKLVLADEPTGNLDERNTAAVLALLQALAHEAGKCVIMVTHEAEVARQCDVVLRLKNRQLTVEQTVAAAASGTK
ncbi:ATP-binding cassette domain-containing protein [Lacticaseibacillus zhaodongensis]|uniref:ATP-binding cassette domain-containing protein n=1 Tax=Lacticaseibacillus zhaodongensis TaxID=2668065 RepID=UPI0012D30CB5|nr:ABC transporter ATP-binding protein [Lacticaseibacillus zhaodongensis]